MTSPELPVTIVADQAEDATRLAATLALPMGDAATPGLHLSPTSDGLSLIDPVSGMSIRAEFVRGAMGYRRTTTAGTSQMLRKAVGLTQGASLHVLDATAGLGRDTFMLAQAGCRVTACERDPVIHALLADGLARARDEEDLAETVARIDLRPADARTILEELPQPPDAIYLDPMFPPRRKSAKVKKEMRLLSMRLGFTDDGTELLAAMLETTIPRIVVKRPLHADPLVAKPDLVLRGKSIRYDLYRR